MKRIILLTSLVLMVIGLTTPKLFSKLAPKETVSQQSPAILDPMILQAWYKLDQQTQPVRLWDGRIISGHDLAQFAVKHAIRIVWGSADICNGNSCSRQSCTREGYCSQFLKDSRQHPIYITPTLRDNQNLLDELVDTLGHELFHYTLPFGPVDDTLFEEYLALYVGAVVSGKGLTEFEQTNPYQPACLALWFFNHNMYDGYRQLFVYPAKVIAEVDTTATTCAPKRKEPVQEDIKITSTCFLDKDGFATCQFAPQPSPTPATRLECTTNQFGLVDCQTIWLDGEATN